MKIKLIRHATCLINYNGVNLLLDPIFYDKGVLSPANGGDKTLNNPTVSLPAQVPTPSEVNAIIVTHLHRDHFDPKVLEIYGKDLPIICPAFFESNLKELGCTQLFPIENNISFKGIEINLTHAQHGTGEVEKAMGNSYGFALSADSEKPFYITGDTIWCDGVANALSTFKPEYILAFAGRATLNEVKITLSKNDILKILDAAPQATVIPIHLEAWNHCILKRHELRALNSDRIIVLNDNESITL